MTTTMMGVILIKIWRLYEYKKLNIRSKTVLTFDVGHFLLDYAVDFDFLSLLGVVIQ